MPFTTSYFVPRFSPACRRMTIVTLLVVGTVFFLSADSYGDLTAFEVVRVYDGDTFFVDIPSLHPLLGDEIGVRVRGVDTPEIRGHCDRERELARRARDFVQERLAQAATVTLVDVERGKYFRIVASVVVDGVDLAELLIAAGLAVPYDGDGPKQSWCD